MRHFQIHNAVVGAIVVVSMLCGGANAQETVPPGSTLVYIGTYTNDGKSKGIYSFALQGGQEGSQNPTLVPLGVAAEAKNPAFLEVDVKRRLLFAVNEMDTFDGKRGGAVSAYSMNPQTGALTLINQQSAMGRGPCHLVLDRTGKNVLVANYGEGNVAVIPVGSEGKLGAATSVVQHEGKSVDPGRQRGPHAHAVAMSPDNKFAFVCDLGLDKVMIYKFDAENGKITANDPAFATVKPGSGPRHIAFRPDGKFAYVNNEMTSTVTAFAYDAAAGKLTEVQTLSTLPEGVKVSNSTAEIAVHPSGKFLYVSNRGHDSIALFNVDQEKGTLTFVEAQETGGKVPRHFGIDPSGKHLIIENQRTNQVGVCAIDQATGRFKAPALLLEVGSPVCAVFVAAEQK